MINNEGLGYYGIQLSELACKARPTAGDPQGRFTMYGNVENWLNRGPGDHGFKTQESLEQGVSTAEIVSLVMAYLDVPVTSTRYNYSCRHHRWGSSYNLLFDIVTRLVLTNGDSELIVANCPRDEYLGSLIREKDPLWEVKEHPVGFYVSDNDVSLLIAGDGRVLDGSDRNIWHEYMSGVTTDTLVESLRYQLQEIRSAEGAG